MYCDCFGRSQAEGGPEKAILLGPLRLTATYFFAWEGDNFGHDFKQMGVGRRVEPQFKNTMLALASDAAAFPPDNPEKAVKVFKEVMNELSRAIYSRPQKPRPAAPRVSKRAVNKWTIKK